MKVMLAWLVVYYLGEAHLEVCDVKVMRDSVDGYCSVDMVLKCCSLWWLCRSFGNKGRFTGASLETSSDHTK